MHRQLIVVVTADSGCRPREGCGLHPLCVDKRWKSSLVAVPARGAGCIEYWLHVCVFPDNVAVPARGAGCIILFVNYFYSLVAGCRPREGCGLHRGTQRAFAYSVVGCRPREGCGLHQQKDTNPYQHICRFHTTRRLSITQGQQKMQGVLCLLYRKRECNLIVGSANRLFLRDKNAREKQRLAGNC